MTDDKAESPFADATVYLSARTVLNEWLSCAGNIYGYEDGEWLPYSELDVDARVYIELGERTFDCHDNTQPLAEFIAELQALAAKAPKKGEVVIDFSAGGYDDDIYAQYEVGYYRDPTKRERAEREETNRKIRERAARKAEEAAERERAEFERMREKYEPR